MSEKTFIPGKDRDLESSIETMQNKLIALGFDIEEASWLNPVPNVYSVHIRDKDCGLMFTNGKGASAKACLASALGEYFERLSCNYFFADFYLGEGFAKGEFVHYPDEKWFAVEGDNIPQGLMDQSLWDFYDPDRVLKPQNLFDTNSGAGERGICALPYQRQRDGQAVYLPVNIIGNLYVSNGMSAGNTQNEARVQSLSEIFERYVKNKIIAEGICLPEFPQAVIDRFPGIKQSVEELQAHGYHLRIADASLGGKYPVISVTLINPKDGAVFASFGAHPCFEVAFERTVTELLQGRSLDQLDGFQPPSFDLDEVADHHNLEIHFIDSSGLISYDFFKKTADFEFSDWNHDSNTENEFDYCCKIIHEMGFDIYISDYNHLDVYACRIIVPGMSDIYPVDDLEWSNNNEGGLFRKDILSLKNLNQAQWQNIFQRLDDGGYNDVQRVAEFIGVAPNPGTVWASLRIGELKAMLCLAIEDYEQAIEWNDWCLNMDQLSDERMRFYRSLQALLEIKRDETRQYADYENSLKLMYGDENIDVGIKLLEGQERFYGLHSPGLSLDGFDLHKKLLQGYAKLHRAKTENWV
ncbi:Ribosomal protein S12p methylthiotransferase accessory factor YcaO [hydrothermal vent metagenome]|uniref:Ribosomal protein S12p methylthiotransferase accessory factor YcaO n=1 Tax=hydrothermal vent metagenome TaxID=652676 RepID=A0A3B0XAA7_9ZZZZ